MDSSGNLYGVTSSGGANNDGTIFEYTPSSGGSGFGGRGGGSSSSSTITVLASFTGASEANPLGLTIDTSGDLFGVTQGSAGTAGVVFKVTAGSKAITPMASLPTGVTPTGGLALSGSKLYGTTNSEVFDIGTAGGAINPLASFAGAAPNVSGPLWVGTGAFAGELFGEASTGGANSDGYLFEVAVTGGTIDEFYNFAGGANGATPAGGLVQVGSELYGVTTAGGTSGGGTAFELSSPGSPTTLADFSAGAKPNAFIAAGTVGILAATTQDGGTSGDGALVELNPVHLAVLGTPVLVGAGQNFSVSVQLEGPTGSVITGNDSAVTLALSSGALSGTLASNMHGGVAIFNDLSVSAAGPSFTITATDANGDTAGVSSSFMVAPAPNPNSTKLAFAQSIANTDGTAVPTFTVYIENAAGVVQDDDSLITVSMANGPAGAVLGTGAVVMQANDGTATFTGVSVSEIGKYELIATDASLTHAVSNVFEIQAAPMLVFSTQPSGFAVHANSATPVAVEFLDQFGKVITSENSAVVLTGAGSIASNTKAPAYQGIATFSNMHFSTTGTYTLTATSGTLTPVPSNSFVVTAGPAVRMAFLQEPPPSVDAGSPFSLSIELFDKYGNVATTDTSTVSLTLTNSSSAGTLSGTVSAAVVNGIANFTNLSIDRHTGAELTVKDSNTLLHTLHSQVFQVS
jgi:uncharacterized repeat protein (TIGR03803 family)